MYLQSTCLKGDESPLNVILRLALAITKSDKDAKFENIPEYITVLMNIQHLQKVYIYLYISRL